MFDSPRLRQLWDRLLPYLPWLSLASGVVSALLLERKPERAWLVAVAAVGIWLATGLALYWTGRRTESGGKWDGVVHFSSLLALQSLIQLGLFFSGPFYVRAATWDVGHFVFLFFFAVAVIAATWDPIFYWVQKNRVLSSALLSFATFAGLGCVLPMLGFSNWWSLLFSSLAATVGIPVLGRLRDPMVRDARFRVALDIGVALVLPLLLWFGAARLVPPAPMRLTEVAFGTSVEDYWVAEPREEFDFMPSKLVCATAIAAPRGLEDALFHVWTHDGELVDRIELKVRGGREEGFRTWSIKRHLSPGKWRCRVETENSQLLGGDSVVLKEAEVQPPDEQGEQGEQGEPPSVEASEETAE